MGIHHKIFPEKLWQIIKDIGDAIPLPMKAILSIA